MKGELWLRFDLQLYVLFHAGTSILLSKAAQSITKPIIRIPVPFVGEVHPNEKGK